MGKDDIWVYILWTILALALFLVCAGVAALLFAEAFGSP